MHASTWMASRPRALLARLLPRRGMADSEDRERQLRLGRLRGPIELRAALLALLLTPGARREIRAWRDETSALPGAAQIRHDIEALAPMARLPWFELFAERAAQAPRAERRALVEAARRVMRADGIVRAQDRLWWLLLRRRLGEVPPATLGGASDNDLSRLDAARVESIGVFSAFLSRLVPWPEVDVSLADASTDGLDDAGERWYRIVMSRWEPRVAAPPRELPDGDPMLRALRDIQTLPWMLKPVLVRAWHDAMVEIAGDGPPNPTAADSLRLACGLLDCPVPPALARHYIEPARK